MKFSHFFNRGLKFSLKKGHIMYIQQKINDGKPF